MGSNDYYQTLGVAKTATADELKKSYRKLAVKYHPDKNPDDKASEAKFKEVTEAYQTLSDPEKRRMYDQFGSAGSQGRGFRGSPFDGAGFSGDPFAGGFGGAHSGHHSSQSAQDFFNDIFGDIFSSQSGRRPQQQKGADLKYNLSLSLEEASTGTSKTVQFSRNSDGQIKNAKLSVNIPPGVRDKQRLKLRGEGDQPHMGVPGDLYVVVQLQHHLLFKRKDNDVYLDLPISFVDAILGTSVNIPTLTGKASLKIPAGTHAGQVFRLKAKGFPDVKTKKHGDLLVKITIDVPQNLNSAQIKLIKELSEIAEGAPKVREFQDNVNTILKARQ